MGTSLTEDELQKLVEAYHTVTVEARQLMALHRRMAFLLGAAKQDMHKLEAAMHLVQELEQETRHDHGDQAG
jgi:hypothetical protein